MIRSAHVGSRHGDALAASGRFGATSPWHSRRVGEAARVGEGGQRLDGPEPPPPDEELAVLHLVVEGMTDAAIARRLGVSPITVRRRMRRLRERLGASTRLQAAVRAVQKGWL